VWPLATTFLQIALHRRGPDVLPASRFFLGLLLIAYLVSSFLWLATQDRFSGRGVLFTLADLVFFLACIFALLRFFKRDRRFLQTASALLGVDILLTAIGIPLALAIRWAAGGASEETVTLAVEILVLALIIWWLDIAAFIVSRAVNQPYVLGLVFVILYWTLSASIGDSFFRASS
jgi:hypothetical protein